MSLFGLESESEMETVKPQMKLKLITDEKDSREQLKIGFFKHLYFPQPIVLKGANCGSRES
jgi:hypothetical protein